MCLPYDAQIQLHLQGIQLCMLQMNHSKLLHQSRLVLYDPNPRIRQQESQMVHDPNLIACVLLRFLRRLMVRRDNRACLLSLVNQNRLLSYNKSNLAYLLLL